MYTRWICAVCTVVWPHTAVMRGTSCYTARSEAQFVRTLACATHAQYSVYVASYYCNLCVRIPLGVFPPFRHEFVGAEAGSDEDLLWSVRVQAGECNVRQKKKPLKKSP